METLADLPWAYILTTMGGYILVLVLIPRLLLDRRGPEATLAWIFIIVFLPYVGAAVFFLLRRPRVRLRARKRRRYHLTLKQRLERLDIDSNLAQIRQVPASLPDSAREIANMSSRLSSAPMVTGNQLSIFIDGRQAYEEMEAAIEDASDHVHLMSYIFRADDTGRRFLKLLEKKAGEGVGVRVLVDGFGSYGLSDRAMRPLVRNGGRFVRFAPILGQFGRWRPNLRNHRKLLVVDGRLGFTGGLNIGDEYGGRKQRFAPWRDTHLKLEGPAVRQLQEVFAEDWLYASREDLAESVYFPDILPTGADLVQVISSGPDLEPETIHRLFFTAVNESRERVYITTPYFVPDPGMLLSLKTASWRGVDVILLVPGRSDLYLAHLAGRSYYPELLDAGVKIYEHHPGILHAKTMVVDGAWSTVGSANMDIRSFRLNYEVNALVWGREFAEQVENIFLDDLAGSRRLTADELDRLPITRRLLEGTARTLSPVL
jgi:cardiolipin synthase